jgi:hypothetical protein
MEGIVRTVKTRLPEADLSREMAAMREWLDRNRYEVRGFNCNQSGDEVVVSVDFMIDAAAEAFAARFDARGHHLSLDGGTVGPGAALPDETGANPRFAAFERTLGG